MSELGSEGCVGVGWAKLSVTHPLLDLCYTGRRWDPGLWGQVVGAYRSSRAEAGQPPWGAQPAVPAQAGLRGQRQTLWEGVNSRVRELKKLKAGLCSQLGRP